MTAPRLSALGRVTSLSPSAAAATFSSTASKGSAPRFHFDSAHFVDTLERDGLSRKQATGLVQVLEGVIDDSISNMKRDLVARVEQEKVRFMTLQRLASGLIIGTHRITAHVYAEGAHRLSAQSTST